MATNQPRKPAGIPTGGQFTSMAHAEADIELEPVDDDEFADDQKILPCGCTVREHIIL